MRSYVFGWRICVSKLEPTRLDMDFTHDHSRMGYDVWFHAVDTPTEDRVMDFDIFENIAVLSLLLMLGASLSVALLLGFVYVMEIMDD